MSRQVKMVVWVLAAVMVFGLAAVDVQAGPASTRTVTCPIDGRSYTVPVWQKSIAGICPYTGMTWSWDIPAAQSTSSSGGQTQKSTPSSTSASGQTAPAASQGGSRAICQGGQAPVVRSGGGDGSVRAGSSGTCKIKVTK